MYDNYMIASFVIMALIFLRHITIYKDPTKLNYAPLIIGIGAIASVIHFIIAPAEADVMFTLKGSFIPFVVALMLYIVMNIMHQTQKMAQKRLQEQKLLTLEKKMQELQKSFDDVLLLSKEDRALIKEIIEREKSKEELLSQMSSNQAFFVQEFQKLHKWQEDLQQIILNFEAFKLPELIQTLHAHLEHLQKEQKSSIALIQKELQRQGNLPQEMNKIEKELQNIMQLKEQIAKEIIQATFHNIMPIFESFQKEFYNLRSQIESMQTELKESESILSLTKDQSSVLHKRLKATNELFAPFEQIVSKMLELQELTPQVFQELHDGYSRFEQALSKLSNAVAMIETKESEHIERLAQKIEEMILELDQKMNQTIDEVKTHYTSATEDITENVKLLAKKAQISRGGYRQEEF